MRAGCKCENMVFVCLFLPAYGRKLPVLNLLTGRKSRFSPHSQGRLVAPIHVKLGTADGHHFQGQKVKGQGHQAALLTAALTCEAGAAVTVRTYWAWETTATLRLLGGAWGARAPTGGE